MSGSGFRDARDGRELVPAKRALAARQTAFQYIVWINLARSGLGGFFSRTGSDWELSGSVADAVFFGSIRSACNETSATLGLRLDCYDLTIFKVARGAAGTVPVLL